jgi:UDP-glucose 4-epimerase
MKFLITGGAGFIGCRLTDLLIREGHEVVIVDNLSTGKKENLNPAACFLEVDVSVSKNKDLVLNELINCHGVFHLAASTKVQESIEDPVAYNKQNVDSTLNILNWAKEAGVKRIVNSSSSAVYGECEFMPIKEHQKREPISPYGLQKLIGEEYCKLFSRIYNIETVNLRYFNVFGEGQPTEGSYGSVVGLFLNQKKEKKPLTIVGNGEQTRDFVYVGDIASANILAMTSEKVGNGECLNIGTNKATSVNEIAKSVGGNIEYIKKRKEPKASLSCNKKAKKLLKWTPSINIKDWIEMNV